MRLTRLSALTLPLLLSCAALCSPRLIKAARAQAPTSELERAQAQDEPQDEPQGEPQRGQTGLAEGEVLITGERLKRKALSTTTLTRLDIESAPHKTAEEVLRQTPGLTLVQHGSEGKGHQFFLRGFDAMHGADFEVSVEGAPLNEWSNVHAQGYLDLALMIPELLREVEVKKGPFELSQGLFAMAGSADYRLGVSARDLGWRVMGGVGSTGRQRAVVSYSPAQGEGEHFFGLEATHDEGFGEQRGLKRVTLNARAPLLTLPQGELSLLTLAHLSSFELPTPVLARDVEAGLLNLYGSYDDQTKGESARLMFVLRFERAPNPQGGAQKGAHSEAKIKGWALFGGYRQLKLLENFTGSLIDLTHGDRREQAHAAWSLGLKGEEAWVLSRSLELRAGLGVRGEAITQQERQRGRALEPLTPRRDLSALQLNAHAMSALSWRPHPSLSLEGGARFEGLSVRGRDALNEGELISGPLLISAPLPRLKLSWAPRHTWAFSLALGRGLRPPEARAFIAPINARAGLSQELVKGEQVAMTSAEALELGARWAPSRRASVSVVGFATQLKREVIFDHMSGLSLALNGTRRLGAELVSGVRVGSRLKLSADVTVVDARFIESGALVPFAPRLTSALRARYTLPQGLSAGLRLTSVAPRPLPHGATGSWLLLSDLTLGYQWRTAWGLVRLHLEVENLLNRALREGEYHYASHWQLSEAVSQLPALHISPGAPLNARLSVGVSWR